MRRPTIGNFGLTSLFTLGRLMAAVYITMALFIFVVLNGIARLYAFSLWQLLKYIRDEILIVSACPRARRCCRG